MFRTLQASRVLDLKSRHPTTKQRTGDPSYKRGINKALIYKFANGNSWYSEINMSVLFFPHAWILSVLPFHWYLSVASTWGAHLKEENLIADRSWTFLTLHLTGYNNLPRSHVTDDQTTIPSRSRSSNPKCKATVTLDLWDGSLLPQ